MSTPDDQYSMIESLVDELLELDAAARATRLDALTQPGLRPRIEALLASDAKLEQTDFMAEPAAPEWIDDSPEDQPLPESIGRYRIVRHLGTGGMGTVYLAEQEEPVRRQVALKVTHGLHSDRERERFSIEAQALASMQHPNVAILYEGGTTDDGTPFVAMEYVDEAMTVVEWCDHVQATIPERLELFRQVCAGVSHAHEQGILHRDLKPANILVTQVDGKPTVKVIDFGIARQFSGDGSEVTRGSIAGSPTYMSPEAVGVRGKIHLDTRSDVYSLGLVLCELIAGELPFEPDDTLSSLVQRLQHDHAEKPSKRLAEQQAGRMEQIASARRIGVGELRRSVVGDIDAIVLKAVAYERKDRYASPLDLARDIVRHLQHRPILARPRDSAYYARRFVRRHRVLVSVSAAILIGVIAGAVAIGVAFRRAVTAERLAAAQRDSAEAVTRFLGDMLKSVEPEVEGRDVKVRTLLDRTATEIGSGLPGQPLVESRIRGTMGESYMALGLLPQAQDQLERSLQLREARLGGRAPETLQARYALGSLLVATGDTARAESMLRETLEIQREVLGPGHRDLRSTLTELAGLHYDAGDTETALSLYDQIYRESLAAYGPEGEDTLSAMHNLALVYAEADRADEAESLYRSVIDTYTRLQGPNSPSALNSRAGLGTLYNALDRLEEAEVLLLDALSGYREAFGDHHPDTLAALNSLAVNYGRQGRTAEATELFAQVLETQRQLVGDGHINALLARLNLSRILLEQAENQRAERTAAAGVAPARESLGAEHWLSGMLVFVRGEALHKLGRQAEAEVALEEARRVLEAEMGADHPIVVRLVELLEQNAVR